MTSLKRVSSPQIWLAFLGLILGSATALAAASIPVQSFHRDSDGVTLAMSPGKMKPTVCDDGIVRVMYSPVSTLPAGQVFVVTNHYSKYPSFQVAEAESKLNITKRRLKIALDYDAARNLLLSEPADGGKAMTPAAMNGESSWQPEQCFISPPDEFIYGLGQFQEGTWNWRGMPQKLRQSNTEISLPIMVHRQGGNGQPKNINVQTLTNPQQTNRAQNVHL